MVKSSIEKLADPIGFEIGASDDVVQSNLLNGFCRGFSNSIIDNHSKELQACHIVEKLDNNSMEVILLLAEFVKERKSNK